MVQMHHAHNRMGHGTSPASAGGSSRHRRVGAWVEGAVLEEEGGSLQFFNFILFFYLCVCVCVCVFE
jgi:hypothetical protein